jgi:FXSXX-COOH protein
MNTTDIIEKQPVNLLATLQRVPLEDMPALDDDVLESATRRLVPDVARVRVPVALFNSAI